MHYTEENKIERPERFKQKRYATEGSDQCFYVKCAVAWGCAATLDKALANYKKQAKHIYQKGSIAEVSIFCIPVSEKDTWDSIDHAGGFCIGLFNGVQL